MNEQHKEQFEWLMGKVYAAICVADFIIFPIMYTIVQFWETQAANDAFRQWQPSTLQNGGFIHLAFGAILGIAAFNKKDEKKEDA
jgi:hypothetical protein